MGQPVVHFEIIGKDPENLRGYYAELFGWEFDTPSPVAQEVSDPESYGFLDLVTTKTEPAFAVESAADRATGVMRSSTSVCRTSRPRCTEPKALAAKGLWARQRRRAAWWSGISPTPKAC